MQAVASAARLREIRAVAYTYVHRFRHRATGQGDAHERRTTLEDISDGLSQLEVELSYSVEAGAEIGMLVPALRVESFHQELFTAIGVTERAATIGQMLNRLGNAIAAELTSVESMEQRAADRRRVRTVVAVTFVTTVSGTLGLFFGFFGINASQVDQNRSMFDDHYTPIYALIATILLCALAIFASMRLQERWEERRDRSRTRTWQSTHRLLAREAGAVILDPTTPPPTPQHLPGSRDPEAGTHPTHHAPLTQTDGHTSFSGRAGRLLSPVTTGSVHVALSRCSTGRSRPLHCWAISSGKCSQASVSSASVALVKDMCLTYERSTERDP
ncbi:hypothetical protein ACIQCG_14805 [Streptomyces noursei]|uniref:hypothetical protein n=1 Tax=Streptomyces noursei TaxID=1971 RepID=UPI00381D4931